MFSVTDREAILPFHSGHGDILEVSNVRQCRYHIFNPRSSPNRSGESSAAPGFELVEVNRILDVAHDGFEEIGDGHEPDDLAAFDD